MARSTNRFARHAAVTAGAAVLAAVAGGGPAPAQEVVSYALDVQPILDSRCASCHKPGGEGFAKSGLDLTSYQGLMTGTKHGAIVIPGDALRSNLIVLIEGRAAPEIRMPHNQRPLLKYQTMTIRDWVKQGAKDN
jgi:hypothetical protein